MLMCFTCASFPSRVKLSGVYVVMDDDFIIRSLSFKNTTFKDIFDSTRVFVFKYRLSQYNSVLNYYRTNSNFICQGSTIKIYLIPNFAKLQISAVGILPHHILVVPVELLEDSMGLSWQSSSQIQVVKFICFLFILLLSLYNVEGEGFVPISCKWCSASLSW